MLRRNLPMFLAACASLGVHALLISQSRRYTLPPLAWAEGQAASAHEAQFTIALSDAAPEDPKDETDPAPAAPPAVPPKPEPPKVKLLPDVMGESTGDGIGSNRAEG